MLNANELGEKGESRFREICADAQLVCNKSDRDLTGWDFIVEFPFDNNEGAALDNRRKPISCHVQVKTLREGSNRFEMRLSSAEQLAKEPKPSFVYVFKVNNQLGFVDSYLIHMLGEPLEMVLKRLRKESASPSPVKINKKNITFPVNKRSVRLNPTGADLRYALMSACGSDMDGYIANKSNQLRTLGFEAQSHEMKAVFHFGNDEEIVDAFLGIKKEIPFSNFKIFQTRFGIKLPTPVLAETGVVSINPSPFDHCSISIRRSDLESPIVFEGEIFVPSIPNLPKEKFKALVKSHFFSIEIKPNKNCMQITSNVDSSVRHTPEEWLSFWRATKILAAGIGMIQIASQKLEGCISIPITSSIAEPSVELCESWINLCEKTSGLLKIAGVLHEPMVTMSNLETSEIQIHLISAMLTGESFFRSFTTEKNDQISKLNQIEMVSADYVFIGDVVLAYYGITKFMLKHDDEQVTWTPVYFEPKSIRDVSNFPRQYEEFLEAAKKATGVQSIISRNGGQLLDACREHESTN